MIGEEYPDGFQPADVPHEDPTIMISVAASMVRRYRDRAAQIDGQLEGHERRVPNDWVVVMNDEFHPVSVVPAEGGHDVEYDGKIFAVRSRWEFGQHLFSGTINGRQLYVQVERREQIYRLFHGGSQADVLVLTPRAAELMQFMPVKAPAGYVQISAFTDAGPAGVAGGQGRRYRQCGRGTGGARGHENGKHPVR